MHPFLYYFCKIHLRVTELSCGMVLGMKSPCVRAVCYTVRIKHKFWDNSYCSARYHIAKIIFSFFLILFNKVKGIVLAWESRESCEDDRGLASVKGISGIIKGKKTKQRLFWLDQKLPVALIMLISYCFLFRCRKTARPSLKEKPALIPLAFQTLRWVGSLPRTVSRLFPASTMGFINNVHRFTAVFLF